MASQFDVNIVSTEIGALSNANRVIAYLPLSGGGITVVGAHAAMAGAATTSLYLVDMGTAGTSIEGTVASFGGTFAANTPRSGSLVTAFVDAGHYIGVKEANVGAANAVTNVSFAYVMGK
jgi:hypothetical protein